MQTAKLTSLLLVLWGLGCSPTPAVKTIPAVRKDPTDLQINAAKNGHLDCDFRGECEPAVALVSVATGEGISRCSGFLISDHEVLTNDHCLESIDNRAEACQGLVFIHFNNDTHRSCKRVVTRSHQTGIDSKDYAVIELDTPIKDRRPLRVSKRGFSDNEMGTIFSVQPSQNSLTHTYDGKQVKLKCQASYSTLMDVNITSTAEPVMTFGNCAIQEGNSGSPIFNESGEVGALVQGYLNVNDDHFSELLKPFLLDGSFGETAIATQTRCMPELVGVSANSCGEVKPLAALFPRQYMDQFGQFSTKTLPRLTWGLFWNEVKSSKDAEKTFVTSPICVSIFEVLTGRLSFTSTAMSYRQGINMRLKAEWRSLYQDDTKETLFVVQKPLTQKPSTADFISTDFGTITVPICTL